MGLRDQERPQRAPIGLVELGPVPQPHEDLLHHLFGEGAVEEHPPGEREAAVAVAAIGLGQGSVVVVDDGPHEAGVVELVVRVDDYRIPRRHGRQRTRRRNVRRRTRPRRRKGHKM